MAAAALFRPLRLAVAGGALFAVAACTDLAAPPPPTFEQQFEVFWASFDRWYPYFELKGVNWDSVRAVQRDEALAAATQLSLILHLREATAPLRDGHVWFEDGAGFRTSTWAADPPANYDEAVLADLAAANGWAVRDDLRWGRVNGVPYLAVLAWSERLSMAEVDAALESFRHDSLLILDVRQNRGGDDRLAYQLAGRFTAQRVLAEYVQTRSGPGWGDLCAPMPRYVEPRGPWTFAGRVALLTGPRSRSATESFVSAMGELANVTVVGERTGGASGSPEPVMLGGGWKVWVPRRFYRAANGAPVEWNGIAPDRAVAWTASPRDTVIQYARNWLIRPGS